MDDMSMKPDENDEQIKNEIEVDDSSPVTVKDTVVRKVKSENTAPELDQKNVLKRKKNTIHNAKKNRRKRIVVEEYSSSSDDDEYSLTVSNLPNHWTYVEIKNYIDKECGPVDEIEMLKHGDYVNCAIRLAFETSEKCIETMKSLQDKTIDGRKLKLEMSATGKDFDEECQLTEMKAKSCSETSGTVQTAKPSIIDEDSWNGDPKDLYGLKPQFLKSLGIKPPLERWVHVTNFRCDKAELRDVLELAGHVVMCSVITVAHKYAKVMYSHPLEAVQAVSMLDGQMFYGKTLKVFMDKDPAESMVLPKGLSGIGLGLGVRGRPLRNITDEYNKYLSKDSSLINPLLFTDVDAEVEFLNKNEMQLLDGKIMNEINEFKEYIKNDKNVLKIKNIEDLDSYEPKDLNNQGIKSNASSLRSSPDLLPLKSNIRMINPQNAPRPIIPHNVTIPAIINPIRTAHQLQNNTQPFRPPILQNAPNFRPGPFNSPSGQFGRPQGPFGPVSGPNFRPQPMPGPFGNISRPQVPMNSLGPRPMMGPNMPTGPQGPATVHFANLPPTTTFPLLSEKLGHCGQVMSVQLTTPGCAVATFAHRAYAERCIQIYNGMNIEGYIISVKII